MCKKCKEAGGGRDETVKQLIGSRTETPVVLGFIAFTRMSQIAQRYKQEKRKQERKRDET